MTYACICIQIIRAPWNVSKKKARHSNKQGVMTEEQERLSPAEHNQRTDWVPGCSPLSKCGDIRTKFDLPAGFWHKAI